MNETNANEKTPFFSICIPTYNRADSYLRETLESALAQTHQDLEILVSDNGSTDNTTEYVNSFRDPRLRYYKHPKNIHYTDHFRFCIEEAKGKYVLLLHDDDLIDPDFIETCARHVNNSEEYGFVRTGMRTMDIHSQPMTEYPNGSTGDTATEFLMEWMDGVSTLYMCNIMYNRKFLLDVGGFYSKTNYYLDLAANFRLAEKYPRKEIEDIKASFRLNNNSMGTTEKLEARIEESEYIVNLMSELLPEDAELLRDSGNKYFFRRMLRYADDLPGNIFTKLKNYKKIKQAFSQRFNILSMIRRHIRVSARHH